MIRQWTGRSMVGLPVLALTAASIVLALRSGLFSTSGRPLTGDQQETMWVFVGTSATALVALLGSLIAAQNEKARLAFDREKEAREQLRRELDDLRREKSEVAERTERREAADRHTVEIAREALGMLGDGDAYAPAAKIAGALATLVELRRTTLALRVLAVTWRDGRVDAETACWVLSRVLLDEQICEDDLSDAVCLLWDRAAGLTDESDPGTYYFPGAFLGSPD